LKFSFTKDKSRGQEDMRIPINYKNGLWNSEGFLHVLSGRKSPI